MLWEGMGDRGDIHLTETLGDGTVFSREMFLNGTDPNLYLGVYSVNYMLH